MSTNSVWTKTPCIVTTNGLNSFYKYAEAISEFTKDGKFIKKDIIYDFDNDGRADIKVYKKEGKVSVFINQNQNKISNPQWKLTNDYGQEFEEIDNNLLKKYLSPILDKLKKDNEPNKNESENTAVITDNKNKTTTITPQTISYTIKNGDSLNKIAKDHGCSVDELIKLNKFKNKNQVIIAGKTLLIPAAKTISSKTTDTKPQIGLTDRDNNIIKNISPEIKKHEKFMPFVYVCDGGARTVGYGHKIQKGETKYSKIHEISDKKIKNKIIYDTEYCEKMMNKYKNHVNEAQAEEILMADIKREYTKMKNALGEDVMNMLSDEQLEALTSLTFNRPINNENTPKLINYLKTAAQAKDSKVREEFLYKAQAEMNIFGAGDKKCAGLIRRRIIEMAKFMNGNIGDEAQARLLEGINKCKDLSKGYKFKSLKEVLTSNIIKDNELKALLEKYLK